MFNLPRGIIKKTAGTYDPAVCHGQACIKGTRIPVHQIISMLANGDTIEELLEEYPSLKREDILACLEYAALLAEEQIIPFEAMNKP
ncbi:MAG: DUF433 domain-containing protein [Bacillota bacterium]|nr:DUF433 domain-containing protein [Bacillota bacterium]